jgi:hypothetical protein
VSESPVGRMRSGASSLTARLRSMNSSMETGAKPSASARAPAPDSSALVKNLSSSLTTPGSTIERCSTSSATDQRSGAER